jgi:hypothetical protein
MSGDVFFHDKIATSRSEAFRYSYTENTEGKYIIISDFSVRSVTKNIITE